MERTMKTYLLSYLLLSMISLTLSAQNSIEEIMQGDNFFEIQAQAEKYFKRTQLKSAILEDEEEDNEYCRYKRWEYENQGNINPDGTFINVLEKANEVLEHQQKSAKIAADATWISTGQSKFGIKYGSAGIGRLDDVAFHPTDPKTFYVSTQSGGGVWKTTDGGLNYSQIGDNLPMLKAPTIHIDRDAPKTLYVLLGETFGNIQLGIYKTTDEGVNWNKTSMHGVRGINDFNLSPTNQKLVMTASNGGLYKSTDGLATKKVVLPGKIFDVEIAVDGKKMYALKNNGTKLDVYISNNEGDDWAKLSSIAKDGEKSKFLIIPKSEQNWLYVCNGKSIHRSKDNGETFEKMGEIKQGGGPAFQVSPNNANILYASFVNPHRSDNGGKNWTKLPQRDYHGEGPRWANILHVDLMKVRINPLNNTIYFCTHGGLNLYDEALNRFTNLSNNIVIRQIYRMSISQNDIRLKTTGTQDNGSRVSIPNQPGAWNYLGGGDGMNNIIDHEDNTIMYSCAQGGGIMRNKVVNSLIQGRSVNIRHKIPNQDKLKNAWVTPYELDVEDSKIITAAYSRLVRSWDRGETWKYLSEDLFSGKPAIQMAVGQINNKIIYCAHRNMFRYTLDEGATWTAIKNFPLPFLQCSRMITNPYDDNTIYCTFNNYNPNKKYRVAKSIDNGETFIDYSQGLPNMPTVCIVFEKNEDQEERLYLGTQFGVYYRDESMSEWQHYGSGLPNINIQDIEIHYKSKKVIAGTFGRGVWEAPLKSNPVGSDNVNSDKFHINVYPNPVNNKQNITIETGNISPNSNLTAKIVDVSGRTVKQFKLNTSQTNHLLSMENLHNGVYFITVSTPNKIMYQDKIIIQ
ncbi:MAG: T9SS type A sorting domain-containing protein [Bacteroidales bacterium]|nr:T9SS type A sorting domain-containing protein [Bacteroidales bacterium]